MSCHALLQEIFLTQGSNPHLLHLLHWQAGSLPVGHLGSPTNLNVIKKYFKEPSKLSKYLSSVAQKGQTGQADGQVGRGHTPTPFPGLPVNKQGIWRFWAFHLSGSNPQPGYPVSCALANTTQAVKHLGPSPLIENLWQLEESGCVFPKL